MSPYGLFRDLTLGLQSVTVAIYLQKSRSHITGNMASKHVAAAK